jgi:anti-sigma regulatory factor (Ser/Thr protein kinase)
MVLIGCRKPNAHHGRLAQMNTPLKSRSTAILGAATVPGRPEEVSGVRAFVARTLSAADKAPPLDSDAATLLTSELVANAIQHTASGAPGGTVTIVVVDVPDGVLVEVVDDGSDGTPVVKRDVLTTNGHGLLLVQQLAAQWGYLRDPAGTTVWFHLSSHWSPDGG